MFLDEVVFLVDLYNTLSFFCPENCSSMFSKKSPKKNWDWDWTNRSNDASAKDTEPDGEGKETCWRGPSRRVACTNPFRTLLLLVVKN